LNGKARFVTDAEFDAVMKMVKVDEFKDRFGPKGYDAVLAGDDFGLSGGQLQRLALAQVTIRKPSVVVLDEATSALDPVNDKDLNDAMRQVTVDQGKTCVMIAHKSASILKAEHLVYVVGGRVQGQGTFKELMKSTPGFEEFLEGKVRGEYFPNTVKS